jgi:hypothetical protein
MDPKIVEQVVVGMQGISFEGNKDGKKENSFDHQTTELCFCLKDLKYEVVRMAEHQRDDFLAFRPTESGNRLREGLAAEQREKEVQRCQQLEECARAAEEAAGGAQCPPLTGGFPALEEAMDLGAPLP